MPKPKRKRIGVRRRGKIVLKEKVEIVQKKDKIRTQQPDTLRRKTAQMPRTAGVVFRVRLKKKGSGIR